MNNRLLLFFVLAALLFAAALPGGIAHASGDSRSYELIEFKHVPTKGYTVVFKVFGNWNQSKHLSKSQTLVFVDGEPYRMACSFKSDGILSCTMNNFAVGQLRGKNVWFWFEGAGLSNGDAMVASTVPQKSRQCHAWQAGFSHFYEEGEWMEMYLASTKTYAELYQYYGWEQWGVVTYGPDAPLDPAFFSLYLEYDYDSWKTFFGTSYLETGAYEAEEFGYYDLGKCASWIDEPLSEASYQYQGWAEWSGESGELCVGTNCWLVDEEWEEYEYESCEAEDGSCFEEELPE